MEDKRLPESIPFVAHEAEVSRLYGVLKKLMAIIILLIVLLVASNAGWIWYESQFEDVVTTTYEADATDGGNAIANGEGSVTVNGNG